MIRLHRTGTRSLYWVGDSIAIGLTKTPEGRWRIVATSYDSRCRDWLRRNPDVEGMTFDKLSEARAYLDAVCELDPLPEVRGPGRYGLRSLGPGHYEVCHPESESLDVSLRRNDAHGQWEVWLTAGAETDAVQIGGWYQSLWHAQASLDHVFRNDLPEAVARLDARRN